MWASQLIEEVGVTLRTRVQALCEDLLEDQHDESDEDVTDGETSRLSSAATSDAGQMALVSRPGSVDRGVQSRKLPPFLNKGRRGSNIAPISYDGRAKGTFSSSFNPLVILDTEPCQICLLAARLHWTATIVWALEQARDNRHSLRSAQQEIQSWTAKAHAGIVSKKRNKRTSLQQAKAQSLLTLMMHLKDQTNDILLSRCRDTMDFGWLKHIR